MESIKDFIEAYIAIKKFFPDCKVKGFKPIVSDSYFYDLTFDIEHSIPEDEFEEVYWDFLSSLSEGALRFTFCTHNG